MFSPRAWGWTHTAGSAAIIRSFSPRAWGWTGERVLRGKPVQVFPTRVGMDRGTRAARQTSTGFPHARGDGPYIGSRVFAPGEFSPRAWGWTVPISDRGGGGVVFPTRVGMDRSLHCSLNNPDGFSPRAWGWTGPVAGGVGQPHVFPTRVGMDRRCRGYGRCSPSFPHARGDGPCLPGAWHTQALFSPRAWGWTVVELTRKVVAVVFPTRGDGPVTKVAAGPGGAFSPRAWGWTDPLTGPGTAAKVLPTRVGMDRSTRRRCSPSNRFPPRAWGWTENPPFFELTGPFSPRVGMDR